MRLYNVRITKKRETIGNAQQEIEIDPEKRSLGEFNIQKAQ